MGGIVDFGVFERIVMILLLLMTIVNSDPITSDKTVGKAEVTLFIKHWNDFNGQFLPTGEFNKKPGFASLVTLLNQNDSKTVPENQLLLSAGNFISPENGWMSVLKYNVHDMTPLVNLFQRNIKLTAFTFAKEDIIYGFDEIISDNWAPLIISNFEAKQRTHTFIPYIPLSHLILQVSSNDPENLKYPIGILGFVDPNIQENLPHAKHTEFNFTNVIPALNASVKEAIRENLKKTDSKPLKFFIVLGNCDSDFKLCEDIFDQIPEIKIIISGGESSERYPIRYKQRLIAIAGKYGSSVGNLKLTFDPYSGEIISEQPILNKPDTTIVPDLMTSQSIANLTKIIESSVKKDSFSGVSQFALKSGPSCRSRVSCPLGNVVADAMTQCGPSRSIYGFQSNNDANYHGTYQEQFPEDLEFFAMRSIYALVLSDSINKEEIKVEGYEHIEELIIHRWIPYLKTGTLARVSGQGLYEILQLGAFFHVSGNMRLQYDISNKDVASLRTISVMSHNSEKFETIDPEMEYVVVLPDEIIQRVGIFKKLLNLNETVHITPGKVNTTCVVNYMKKLELVTLGFEERIFLHESDGMNWAYVKSIILSTLLVIETLVLIYILRDRWLGIFFKNYRQRKLFTHQRLATNASYSNDKDVQFHD